MKKPRSEGERWIRQARHDLETAEFLYSGERWSDVCFSAQQSAEKAIKAWLYASGERMVFGHSVAMLAKQASQKEPGFTGLIDIGTRLDRFYIPTRYPNGLPGGIPAESYSRQDSDQALALARNVLEFVETRLESA